MNNPEPPLFTAKTAIIWAVIILVIILILYLIVVPGLIYIGKEFYSKLRGRTGSLSSHDIEFSQAKAFLLESAPNYLLMIRENLNDYYQRRVFKKKKQDDTQNSKSNIDAIVPTLSNMELILLFEMSRFADTISTSINIVTLCPNGDYKEIQYYVTRIAAELREELELMIYGLEHCTISNEHEKSKKELSVRLNRYLERIKDGGVDK